MTSPLVKRLAARYYGTHPSESELLDQTIRAHLTPESCVLDLGCGGGKLFPHDYRGNARIVVGVDVDRALSQNPTISFGVFGSAGALPFRDSCFDVVFSRYVFEHLSSPQGVFDEVARVLRSGGKLIVLTPNLYHYVATVSRLTPAWFHRAFNAHARGRKSEDTFPTLYKANTVRTLRKLAVSAGMKEFAVDLLETRPNYLMWSVPAFFLGVVYERIVNSTELLRQLRVNLLATYQKL